MLSPISELFIRLYTYCHVSWASYLSIQR